MTTSLLVNSAFDYTRRRFSGHVIEQQLQRFLPAKFIDRWPEHRVDAGVQGIGRAETHRFEGVAAHADLQFEMLLADDTLFDDAERAGETGRYETLAPDLRIDGADETEIEFGRIKCTIRFNSFCQVGRRQ